MSKIIFFDTETTGVTENDFLCQIAYITDDENFVGLYKPAIQIPSEASAVHHITNKMVEDKPAFSETSDKTKIKDLFENKNSIVVAHNAPFDLMIIKNEGIVPLNFICTLKVARHLDKDGKIDRYSLQNLRYQLGIEVEATAHDAMGDVTVLEKLFERLKNRIMKDGASEEEALVQMMEISQKPSLHRTFRFGKHIGKKVEDVVKIDKGYLEWLLAQKELKPQGEDDWIYTLRHFLGK